MTCPFCGYLIRDPDRKRCGHCGQFLPVEEPVEAPDADEMPSFDPVAVCREALETRGIEEMLEDALLRVCKHRHAEAHIQVYSQVRLLISDVQDATGCNERTAAARVASGHLS